MFQALISLNIYSKWSYDFIDFIYQIKNPFYKRYISRIIL